MNLAMVRLYCGNSGKKGFYNMQELGLAKALARKGINVYIILLSTLDKVLKEDKEFPGVTLLTIPARKIANHGFFDCSIITKLKIDVVHLQSDNQIYAPYVMNFCKKNEIKCYNYVGTLKSDSNNLLKRKLMDILAKRNIRYYKKNFVFAKTPTVRKQLIERGIKDVEIAPVALDIEIIPIIKEVRSVLRERLKIPQDKKVIIFVGRLEEYKKPLNAIELISQLGNEFYLIIIGKGLLKSKIFSKIKQYRLQNKVKYIESVPNEEIHAYYKASDFFVNFNDKEIFGMSILEAMNQGCTVVAVNAPGPEYIIEDGVSGYIVENYNEMKNILENSQLCSEESKQRILTNFQWENTCDIIFDHIFN